MYQNFFQFTRRAFSPAPDSSMLYATPEVDATIQSLEQILRQGEGIGLLTASAGVGKTIICKVLQDRLECDCPICSEINSSQIENSERMPSTSNGSPSGPIPVLLLQPQFPTRSSLLQAILFELNQSYARMTEQELRLELIRYGREVAKEHQGIAIIVDEAHLLGEHILEELRGLTNYKFYAAPIFRIVLSGQIALEETLTSRSLEALNQRLGCHVSLETLTRQQSVEYIETRIQRSGANSADVFTDEAMELIVRAADGLPRCLNQLCDHVCLLASLAMDKPAGGDLVREALEDLMKLPLHWNALPAKLDPISELTGSKNSIEQPDLIDVEPVVEESFDVEFESQESFIEISPAVESASSVESNVFEPIQESPIPKSQKLQETPHVFETETVSGSTSVIEIGVGLSAESAVTASENSPVEQEEINAVEDAFEEVVIESDITDFEVSRDELMLEREAHCLEPEDSQVEASYEISESVDDKLNEMLQSSNEIEQPSIELNDSNETESVSDTWEEEIHDRYAELDARRLGQLNELVECETIVDSVKQDVKPEPIQEVAKVVINSEQIEHQLGQSILDLTTELSRAISGYEDNIIPNPDDIIVTASESIADYMPRADIEYDVVEPESEADSEYNRLSNELRKRDQ